MLILFWTGARNSEVLNLTINNLDLSIGAINFETLKRRRKGIYRSVPIPPSLIGMLKIFLNENAISLKTQGDSRLFKFCRRTSNRYIKKIMIEAKVFGPQSSPKGLRHSFAVFLVMNGIPLTTIQKWLGHASIITTSLYLNIIGPEEKVGG